MNKTLRYWHTIIADKMRNIVHNIKGIIRYLFTKGRKKHQGYREGEWDRKGFLCVCDSHVDTFAKKQDGVSGAMDWYVCAYRGCGKPATNEIFPDLTKTLEEFRKGFDNED